MSGMMMGLTIGFAFAGAAAGAGLKLLSEMGSLTVGMAEIFGGGRPTQSKTPSLASFVLVGTFAGAALGAGTGWVIDGGTKTMPELKPTMSQNATDALLKSCTKIVGEGSAVSVKIKDGKMTCSILKVNP